MEQDELLGQVAVALDRLAVPYMVVGSYGSSLFGELRFTFDIDMVIDLPASRVADFCAAFPPPDFYLSEPAVRDAVRTRFQFNLLHPASGHKVDFMFPPADEWGRTQLSRRRRVTLDDGTPVFVASPEDVIVGKLWYFAEGRSDKHLNDIAGMLKANGGRIDRAEIARWADHLGYADVWRAAVARADNAFPEDQR